MGESIKDSMNSMLLGSFLINFFVSVSMKQLLQAIRVFQFIAFFILLPVSFTPESKLVMETMYKFVTFKVIPEEVMQKIMVRLGLKKSLIQELPEINFNTTSRRLEGEEGQGINSNFQNNGFKKNFSLAENMNLLLIVLVGVTVMLILGYVIYKLL